MFEEYVAALQISKVWADVQYIFVLYRPTFSVDL